MCGAALLDFASTDMVEVLSSRKNIQTAAKIVERQNLKYSSVMVVGSGKKPKANGTSVEFS